MNAYRRPRFNLDVAEALHWLNTKAGADVAEKFFAALKATIAELARQPFIGRLRADLRPRGTRTWRIKGFERWLIFYTVEEPNIILCRLREGSMNLPSVRIQS